MDKLVLLGDKVVLTLIQLEQGRKQLSKKQYVCVVQELEEENYITVSMPIEHGKILLLKEEQECHLCFYTKKGLYQCNGEVTTRLRENNIVLAKIKLLTDFEKYQRRQFFRLEKLMEMEYRIVSEEEKDLWEKVASKNLETIEQEVSEHNEYVNASYLWRRATLTDLSGGGARFHTKEYYELECKLVLKIKFTSTEGTFLYELNAEVVSSKPLVNNPKVYEIRVEFSDIDYQQRERIIKYIFEEERKQRWHEKGLM